MQYHFKNFPASFQSKEKQASPIQSKITIYVALRILNLMKKTLGLEAMLEYIDCSLDYVAKTSPALKVATEEILKTINVENIYKEILINDTNKV